MSDSQTLPAALVLGHYLATPSISRIQSLSAGSMSHIQTRSDVPVHTPDYFLLLSRVDSIYGLGFSGQGLGFRF